MDAGGSGIGTSMVLSSAADEVCANMPVVEKVNTATIAVAIMALSFILQLVFLL